MELPHIESVKDPEKKEGRNKSIEYKDAKGNVVCKAEIVYSKESMPIPGSKEGRVGKQILSYVLTKEMNGKVHEIDLFKLTGIDRLGYTSFVCDGFMVNEHSSKEKTIIAEIESPLGVATFLHEAGHAAQYNDKKFDGVKEEYSLPSRALPLGLEGVGYDSLLNVAKRFGLENDARTVAGLSEYKRSYDLYIDLKMEKYKLEQKRERIQNQAMDIQQKTREIKMLEEGLIENAKKSKENIAKSLLVIKQLDALVRLPQRALERDATKRAIEWMERIFEVSGIDLFVEVQVPESMLEEDEIKWYEEKDKASEASCNSSISGLFGRVKNYVEKKTKGIKTNAKTRLSGHGLMSYGAADEQMKNVYGSIPELINQYSSTEQEQTEYKMAA